jgi:glycosyltransferase involved in cell wall biosynthesis
LSPVPFKTLILHFGLLLIMISVLIPTYNCDCTPLVCQIHKQLVDCAIDFEIIVVDDASSDAPITAQNATISTLSHTYFIRQTTNQGRTATRQFLSEQAQFEHLLFMDADTLPKNPDFIQKFVSQVGQADVIFGGIEYAPNPPAPDEILRWVYGKKREGRSVVERQKIPYLSIISQCLLIRKEIFQQANTFFENRYGVDVLFTQNLEQLQVLVLHIDNPIIHWGLETNQKFIDKTKKGIESLVYFEERGLVPSQYRPIQKASHFLRKYRLSGVFSFIMSLVNPLIKQNLISARPSLFLFDLYKLDYFLKIKRQENA